MFVFDDVLFVEELVGDSDATPLIARRLQAGFLTQLLQYRRRRHRISPYVVAEPASPKRTCVRTQKQSTKNAPFGCS